MLMDGRPTTSTQLSANVAIPEADDRPFHPFCVCISFPSMMKSADFVPPQSPYLYSTVARGFHEQCCQTSVTCQLSGRDNSVLRRVTYTITRHAHNPDEHYCFRTIFLLSLCQAASPNLMISNVENTAYPTLACCVSKLEYCRGGQITHEASECNVQV
jgi:hypothetical protein